MPLTIQYCSDLHLEFDRNRKWMDKYPLTVAGDILLLGGDILLLAQQEQHNGFLDFVSCNYQAVYWIPGNHEHYQSDIATTGGTLHRAVRDNVFLLNNTTVHLGNTDLICSTFWSHISPRNEWEIARVMSDFKVIQHGGSRLTVSAYNQLHAQAKQYLEQALHHSTATHKIILTHHVPTLMNYPPKYRNSELNEAFAVELHDLIENSGADCWIYGHTHANTLEFTIGRTRMLTNQLGYVQYGENRHFDGGRVIVVG